MDIVNIGWIAASLVALMWMAYRGASVVLIAAVLAMVTATLASDINPLVALTEHYMPAVVSFIKTFFPLFLAGAVFGRVMGVSSAANVVADSIASLIGKKQAILIVVMATAILTYGGVSLFVVVFAVYPIAVELFRTGNIPKRLIAPAIALGGFTFTMTALPGSPQAINAIPIKYLGTTIYAAPILGLLAAALILGLGMLYLGRIAGAARSQSEGYGQHDDNLPVVDGNSKLPGKFASFLPLLIVFIGNYLFTWMFQLDSVKAYFATQGMPATSPVNNIWPIITSITLATVVALILYRKHIDNMTKTLNEGATGSLLPIFNTASENGYGGVMKVMPGFTALKGLLLLLPFSPLFQVAIATTVLAGIVGSSSAGTALALETFGDVFAGMMQTHNIPAEVMHRVILLSAGSLDTLPHCGAIITLLSVTKLTHKECYKDIAVLTMGIPAITVITVIGFYSLTGIY
jgi:H+/gluconate symporter-like permease